MFGSKPKIINITSFDVNQRLKKGETLTIIDVRENDEVAAGKIPGAKHIRLSELPQRIHEIPKNAEAIMVCRSGGRSAKACEFLLSQGYRNVKNLMGGMLGWDGDIER
ncbi:rhodanese-like domain-containing protein [Fodinisporobacter ferrooxydans]|uniref:Rhodanese-like domain-containing protein n=1 Tax=Fodinisporobacter ferrooxydans TaxID=2901836 RepID=A0ABY4CJX1_9BACL|nr:rhodanese-like domain-containing protein [Alicyclobacillaceae bacterium MYW30-H2]